MHHHDERGMALVLTLFLTSAMTVLAVSLMFLSQTETYASMNYKMMSLARYGAEAGVERAVAMEGLRRGQADASTPRHRGFHQRAVGGNLRRIHERPELGLHREGLADVGSLPEPALRQVHGPSHLRDSVVGRV